jgi:transcriptional regulator with XRE-family HTH domain
MGDVSTNYSDDDFARAVGVEIVAARRMKDLSQEGLALRAGIGVRTLSRYEHGDRDLKLKVLWAITGALGVEAFDVLSAAQDRATREAQEGSQT